MHSYNTRVVMQHAFTGQEYEAYKVQYPARLKKPLTLRRKY